MRALIVDDERLARNELRRLLGPHPEIEIVGEAASARDARKALQELDPELLFLDVQMPGETGFDLLASLDSVPLVVFTTAYDEFALRAFEVSALDYLVKPIDPRRLASTISRLPAAARPDTEGTLPATHRVFVREGDRCWLVELGAIRLFEAEGNDTRVFFGEETPLIHRSLQHLEARLDARRFFRANRRQIINLDAVRGIREWIGGRLKAEMEGGQEVILSRRRARALRERMTV
jgi:two-component system LytT family response regulator